ncbi:Putative molybdenum cofactor biosynthesis protein D2 (MoaD2) / thiamineS [Mycobacteroides abscessus]|uniref:Molybdopterin synthase sulfur carrier subunit n=5 Tax=Mycobacteroides abscessus TaxID=36809 RepID=A0A0U0ZR88_9MYCO|nr:MoaD/ThiS family protein [Mycobacteroides abscessus]ESV58591.1 thiS family protein [Mycobacteroides abscessus MAB_082312_2258]ESV61982.1 thiS family protein [Mycobacteroides abscessus MAB_091912_2446]AGM27484.1 putative molybdenum cofactor biosynthesis protein D2 (MoaD2) / sulfur transfer protein ThiS [Mycobacteroides abscessus subsp. bolletii 50594]AMU24830.1 molybdopterin synthase sulfur carrier subunit [Mycobacteroides abscessus]AMU34559.1 molybdopterin synthase sulfur carrier subunit [M
MLASITVRYFAAAAAAAGLQEETVDLPAGASFDDLTRLLASRGPELERVLARCSFLHDGMAVRDRSQRPTSGAVVDVLPPFAGG